MTMTTGEVTSSSHAPAVSWGPNLPAPGATDLADLALRAAAGGTGEIRLAGGEGPETALGYGELVVAASRVLGGMRDRGAKAGDKVVITVGDDRGRLCALWACLLGGLVPLPVDPGGTSVSRLDALWSDDDTIWTIADTRPAEGSRAVFLGTAAELETGAATADYTPGGWDDLAVLLAVPSGGAVPRTVMLSHGNIISRTVAAAHVGGLDSAERSLCWMGLHQAGGLMSHLRDMYLRCTQIHVPAAWILADPLRWIDQLHRHRATVAAVPGIAFGLVCDNATRMRDRHWDLARLRHLAHGGDGAAPESIRRFSRLLAPHGLSPAAIHQGWGRTETCSTIVDCKSTPDAEPHPRALASGHPYPGVGLRIVDHFDELLPEGELGLLEVTGEQVTSGYYGDPESNRRAFSADRWFKTGELAFIRRGRLTVTGGTGDIIVIDGEAHRGRRIEQTTEAVAAVQPSSAVACTVTDPGSGEPGLAIFYVPNGCSEAETAAADIRRAVDREHGLTARHIVPVAEADLPETGFPRLRRSLLAQRFESGAFAAAPGGSEDACA